jgi:hypothetical protein
MSVSLRPHRGGTVLGLGILGLAIALAGICVASQGFRFSFFCVVGSVLAVSLGLLAILIGWRQAIGMSTHRIDPMGRRKTRSGQALGAAAVLLSVGLSSFIFVYFPADHSDLYADGTLAVTEMYYGHVLKAQFHEVLGPDRHFVKEGAYVAWSRSGKKLEEGNYHVGKRNGPWTFWSEDGSIDEERSGVYQDDVKIGPSPVGDFPVDEDK